MSEMNDSKFHMWRACVAIVYLDNKVSPEENKWVEEKITVLKLTDDQRNILRSDLKNGVNFDAVFVKITDKVDRAFLINTFRVLAHLDNDFSAVEKEALKKYEALVLKSIDLNEANRIIQTMEINSYHEKEVYKNVTNSKFEGIINSFSKWNNPGNYKKPK